MTFTDLVNLCPHPVVVYPQGAPDVITLGTIVPVRVIDREPEPARIATAATPTTAPDDAGPGEVPLYDVRYWPQHVSGLPDPAVGIGYIVSLPVALGCPARTDLLVPYREVRNRTGTVIGCRALSRPITSTPAT